MNERTLVQPPTSGIIARFFSWIARGQELIQSSSGLAIILLLTALFLGPLLGAALLSQTATALFWFIFIADLLILFAFALVTFRQPTLFLGIVILWFALQRIVVAALSPQISPDVIRLLLAYKEGFYLILVAAGSVAFLVRYASKERTVTPVLAADGLAIAFVGLLALHFLVSSADLTPRLIYLRSLGAPALLYLGGRLLTTGEDQLTKSLRFLIIVTLGVAVFGLIERFLLDLSFWRNTVDSTSFYVKQVESGLLPSSSLFVYQGVPDGVFIGLPLEVPVRRLVSTYLQPAMLGSFLAFALVLLLLVPSLNKDRYRILAGLGVLLLALAITATLSRAAMLTVLASLALFIAVGFLRKDRRLLGQTSYLLLAPVVLITSFGFILTTFPLSDLPGVGGKMQNVMATSLVSGLSETDDTTYFPYQSPTAGPVAIAQEHPPGSTAEGASKHFKGLTTGLRKALDDPLGGGLGTAGGSSDAPQIGGESTVGTISAQLGIPGLLLWVGFLLAIMASLLKAWQGQPVNQPFLPDLSLAVAAAFFGLFITFWFSESASGLLGNAFYFLFVGWALTHLLPTTSRLHFRWLPGSRRSREMH